MLNDPRTHGLWEETAPPAPATETLSGEISAEVAVIGGGYSGLSAALHLAEQGVDVALLEAAEIGFGGAGRNVGLVNAGMWVMPDALVQTLGNDLGNRLIDFLGEGPARVWEIVRRYRIDCQANPVGTLHAGVGRAGMDELRDRARQWQTRGAPVELLDADEAAARIGSRHYAGALLDRRAGTIQPLAYARGLARAAIGQGARVFTRSAVTSMTPDSRGGWRLGSSAGVVRAGRVVFATDAYTRHLMPDLRRQQVFLPYFNMATQPLPDEIARTILPGREGVWDTRDVLSSFRFDAANRLVFGSVGALRAGGAQVHRAWARRAMRRIFPQIGPVTFGSEWFGTIGMTSDNLPRFHVLDEGVYSFCGFNGRGIAPGTAFGALMADLLRGVVTEADLPLSRSVPRAAPLRALRGAGFEAGAVAVHLTEARL